MSFLALSNNVNANVNTISESILKMDSEIFETIMKISIDSVINLEQEELKTRIESLKNILVNTMEISSEEETELLKEKINLIDKILSEKYPTLWKKVKNFVVKHKLAVSATTIVLVAAIVITVFMIKKNNKSKSETSKATEGNEPPEATNTRTEQVDFEIIDPMEQQTEGTPEKEAAIIRLALYQEDKEAEYGNSSEITTDVFDKIPDRVKNLLFANGIDTEQKLRSTSSEKLSDIDGFGKAAHRDVFNALRQIENTPEVLGRVYVERPGLKGKVLRSSRLL